MDDALPRIHAGEILLINAGKPFVKGRTKNKMLAEQVRQVGELCLNWQAEEDVAAVVKWPRSCATPTA